MKEDQLEERDGEGWGREKKMKKGEIRLVKRVEGGVSAKVKKKEKEKG